MKRNISDMLDTYFDDSVELDGDTPLSAAVIKELTMTKITQEGMLKTPRQRKCITKKHIRKPIARSLLIAAIIVSFCCLTVFAITFSLRDVARADMGVSEVSPIPEWTEYDETENTSEEPQNTQVKLMSTMCSGEQLYAYIAISPVPEDIAAVLAENTPEYEWDFSGSSTYSCSYNLEQIDYDSGTQTALVKVYIHGKELEQLEQVELTVELTHNLKPQEKYGPIVIPITASEMISTMADIPVENTKDHFESAWGLRPDMPELSDYISEGTITRISICAGYIEIEMETPSLEQWLAESGVDQLDFEISPDMVMVPGMEDWYLKRMFSGNWHVSIHETLEDATLNYRDGTSVLINELPRVFAGVWSSSSDPYTHPEYEGKHTFQFIPKQAFDLSMVKSITVGDTDYFFIATEEIDA